MGPEFFREAAAIYAEATDGPPDRVKLMNLMQRNGITPAPQHQPRDAFVLSSRSHGDRCASRTLQVELFACQTCVSMPVETASLMRMNLST